MKYLIILALLLNGCVKAAQESAKDGEFEIETLFTKDGCTLYRFNDAGRYVYFTNCSGSTHYSETCGKNCSRSVDVD